MPQSIISCLEWWQYHFTKCASHGNNDSSYWFVIQFGGFFIVTHKSINVDVNKSWSNYLGPRKVFNTMCSV